MRVGILGAARIAPAAIVQPARQVAGAETFAIAARDPLRAAAFAARHGIPRVHDSYQALLEDPDVEAVYVALPNGLHARWTIRALEAGKHVLCEKPFAANADEAERVAAAAERAGREAIEAFHWRYHALASRMREIVASGELGEVRSIEAHVCFPLLSRRDIRYRLELAGGALMDAGCYAVSVVRHLARAEPRVSWARARLAAPQIDRWAEAGLEFADGREARISCSLLSIRLLRVSARVQGSRGRMSVINPIAPHVWHRLRVRTRDSRRSERVHGESTYAAQLRAFAARLRGGPALPTSAEDAVANQRVVDAVYVAAGLARRGTAA